MSREDEPIHVYDDEPIDEEGDAALMAGPSPSEVLPSHVIERWYDLETTRHQRLSVHLTDVLYLLSAQPDGKEVDLISQRVFDAIEENLISTLYQMTAINQRSQLLPDPTLAGGQV